MDVCFSVPPKALEGVDQDKRSFRNFSRKGGKREQCGYARSRRFGEEQAFIMLCNLLEVLLISSARFDPRGGRTRVHVQGIKWKGYQSQRSKGLTDLQLSSITSTTTFCDNFRGRRPKASCVAVLQSSS
jgi:hypothetical protein